MATFAVRFLPTCILTTLMEGYFLITLCEYIPGPKNCTFFHGNTNSTEPWNGYRGSYKGALVMSQNTCTLLFVIHLCFISASFVFPKTHIWSKIPLRNLAWTLLCPLVIILQIFYFASDVHSFNTTPFNIDNTPGYGWAGGIAWTIIALLISEAVKAYEISKASKQHRRCKLQFGTKLGMNSPF